jgi:hypothetical protein
LILRPVFASLGETQMFILRAVYLSQSAKDYGLCAMKKAGLFLQNTLSERTTIETSEA